MLSLRNFRNRALLFLAMCGALFLVYSTPARGQGIARDALASFPTDTQQLAYTNLAELRNASDYAKLRGRLWGPQLRGFVEFLRDAGDDPEKDVDEVVLGWRTSDTTGFFGLANGRFHPSQVREFFARRKLPTSQYAGSRLYSSGKEGRNFFFTFLSDSSAAFGRLNDLEAILDVRAGSNAGLDSNSSFLSWEGELEGSALEWGVATGNAAVKQAALWLNGGMKPPTDLGALMGPVQAFLYSIDLRNDLSTHISVICDRPETAAALAQILTLWRNSHPVAPTSSPNVSAFLEGLDISADGARVELRGSGPSALLDELGS